MPVVKFYPIKAARLAEVYANLNRRQKGFEGKIYVCAEGA